MTTTAAGPESNFATPAAGPLKIIRRGSGRVGGRTILRMLAIAGLAFALPGCVSTKYKFANKDTPPAAPLNLIVSQAPAELTVHTVIVYEGPGSWKRRAYWDEYVLTIANRGDAPLTLESAALVDFQDKQIPAGSDPWQLEKESKTWWQNVKSSETGRLLTLGAGTAVVGTAFVLTAGSVVFGATSGVAAGAAVVLGAATIALPVYAVTTVFINISGRHKIEAEFNRRRLALPATIAPGQDVQGSLFFRVTPGPRRLLLHGRTKDGPCDLAFDLTPLAGLHFKEAPHPAGPGPAEPARPATPSPPPLE